MILKYKKNSKTQKLVSNSCLLKFAMTSDYSNISFIRLSLVDFAEVFEIVKDLEKQGAEFIN